MAVVALLCMNNTVSLSSFEDYIQATVSAGGDVSGRALLVGMALGGLGLSYPPAWEQVNNTEFSDFKSIAFQVYVWDPITSLSFLISLSLLYAFIYSSVSQVVYGSPECTAISRYGQYCNSLTWKPYQSECEFSNSRCSKSYTNGRNALLLCFVGVFAIAKLSLKSLIF